MNLTGVFYVAQTAARHMWERGSGVILQTASTNGVMGYPYYADYNATKAGVIELTRSMALELAPKVRVCAVAPGYVLTPMQRAEYSDAMLEEVNQKIPLRTACDSRRRLRGCLRIWRRTMRRSRLGRCSRWMAERRREGSRAGEGLLSGISVFSVVTESKPWSQRSRGTTSRNRISNASQG